MYNEPFGWPRGSVRALLTVLVLVAAVVLHVLGEGSIELDGLAAIAVGYYVGYRGGVTTGSPAEPSVDANKAVVIPPADTTPDTTGFVAGE